MSNKPFISHCPKCGTTVQLCNEHIHAPTTPNGLIHIDGITSPDFFGELVDGKWTQHSYERMAQLRAEAEHKEKGVTTMQFDIVIQLRNPPFGTETTERNLMGRAADEIERLREHVELLDLRVTRLMK